MRAALLSLPLILSSALAGAAGWTLDGADSQLSFVSVKSGNLGETHYFEELSGSVDETGMARIEIDLASVETRIDIRNDRMREFLFETDRFPRAVFTAEIDLAAYEALAVGERAESEIDGTLSLHGFEIPVEAPIIVTRIAEDRVDVTTAEPALIYAEDFGLVAGIEKLAEIAQLDWIIPTVPVNASFVFQR